LRLRYDRLVDDVDHAWRATDDDMADRLAVELHDSKATMQESLAVAHGLGVKLMLHQLLANRRRQSI
jgi:hypothetical protein